MSDKSNAAGGGITIGMVIAFVLSWTTNHAIFLGLIHALFSWIYVIYWVLVYGPLKN
jgi:hypothetical protein